MFFKNTNYVVLKNIEFLNTARNACLDETLFGRFLPIVYLFTKQILWDDVRFVRREIELFCKCK